MRNTLSARTKKIATAFTAAMFVMTLFGASYLSADEHPLIFDWNTFVDTSVPGVTPIPHPVFRTEDWQSLFDTQNDNGGLIGFMLRNFTAPIGGTSPDALSDTLSFINSSGYLLNFVFADFEGTSTQDDDTEEMVSQVRNHANNNINIAYIGNYGDCATSWDYREVWGNFDRTDRHDFYVNSGLNVSMPDTYPYSVYRNHAVRSDIFGSNLCVSIPHALFWAGLERYSAAMRELPSGHIMIPWMGGFYYNSGYEAPIPSKTECRSLLQHIRLRGSAGYYTWSNGDNTNYTSKVDYRDDMYANAWQPLDWFFSYPASEVIFNLATNKTGGVEWSGMRRGNRCLFIFSNYTGNAVQVNLPGTVENLPAQSPSIASGEHLMMDYIVGPLSYWKLDENTENNVYDKMEGNYSGTITGASWSAGKNGSALTFDGIGGGVNFGDILDIGTKDRSVSLWFKTTDSSNQKSLISKGYSCTSNEFSLYLYSGNIIGLMDINGTDYIVSSNQTVNDGQWHHAVLTIARNDKMSLYLDGTLKANVDVSAVASVNAQNNYNLYLGRSHYGQYFAGTIDEVKIFSSALTEQEVFDEYAAVLNLHFNERQDSTVADDSIYSNDGTVSSGSWTNGKSGSCLNFTGGYDSFSVTDSSSLDLSSEISVETWFYPTAYGSGYATFPVSKWARYNTSTANFTMYFFGATAGSNYKKICFAANAGGTWKTVSPTYSIDQLNTWYHIVWTYSATNGGKLYVNGVSQGSAVGSGSLYINNSNVVIGDQVQGKIDEVKIFNKALSEDEVIRQYNRY